MPQMIRKQIYITRKQQLLLTKLTKVRGLSESEVILQAIEHEATGSYAQETGVDAGSLDKLIEFARSRRELGSDGEPLQWSHEDSYVDRLDRYGQQAEH